MSSTKPLISVLISVRNGGDKFNLTMNSIAAQSLDRSLFEVLICNNGSTDNTADLIKKWEEKGICKLAVENKSTKELTCALIQLAKQATGKYLARVDVGDTCHPERLKKQLTYLEQNNQIGMVCTTSLLMFQDQRVIGPLFVPLSKEVKLKHLIQKNIIVHGSIMMRKEAYETVGGYDIAYDCAEDFDLWTRMLSHGIKIHWLKDPLYLYELDEEGLSATRKEEQARLGQQIKDRYKKINTSSAKPKSTNLTNMRRRATLRGIPCLGRVLQIMEGIIFEIR